jgi:hypothetical protein
VWISPPSRHLVADAQRAPRVLRFLAVSDFAETTKKRKTRKTRRRRRRNDSVASSSSEGNRDRHGRVNRDAAKAS